MVKAEDILISLHRKYVSRMLDGQKTVELRRRALRVARGTRVWIYSKSPHATVDAFAIVDQVISAPPDQLWRDYEDRVGVSELEFRSYFLNASQGCALVLRSVQGLPFSVSLADLRRHSSAFHPPQFFLRLPEGCPALRALRTKSRYQDPCAESRESLAAFAH